MALINGPQTPNLSVPTLGPTDDLNKATINAVLNTLDTRINVVADETQALSTHEADTTNVHGITNTANLLATADTPANGEVLTYTTAGGVNWAAAAGGGSFVGCALNTSNSANIDSFLPNSPNYIEFNSAQYDSGGMFNAATSTTRQRIIVPETGKYLAVLSGLHINMSGEGEIGGAFYIFTTAAGGTRILAPYGFGYTNAYVPTGFNYVMNTSSILNLTAGQSVAFGLFAYMTGENSATSYDISGNPNGNFNGLFSLTKV